MIRIRQFRYSADNLAYLAYAGKEAMAIDGGAVQAILSFAEQNGLVLKYATNTHSHPDHTTGTSTLVRKSGAELLDHNELAREGVVRIDGEPMEVFATPGHTADSVSFYTGDSLISGDTLFNGTVGNCFSGDLESFYRSIKRILSLPDETVVYAGHDYVLDSIAFARQVEPDNPHYAEYLRKYTPYHVRSTLADERKVNPFLRFNAFSIVALLEKKGLATATELDRWNSTMTL